MTTSLTKVMRAQTNPVRDHAAAMQRLQDQYFATLKRAHAQYFDAVKRLTDNLSSASAEQIPPNATNGEPAPEPQQ
jgi:hypothetical protein